MKPFKMWLSRQKALQEVIEGNTYIYDQIHKQPSQPLISKIISDRRGNGNIDKELSEYQHGHRI